MIQGRQEAVPERNHHRLFSPFLIYDVFWLMFAWCCILIDCVLFSLWCIGLVQDTCVFGLLVVPLEPQLPWVAIERSDTCASHHLPEASLLPEACTFYSLRVNIEMRFCTVWSLLRPKRERPKVQCVKSFRKLVFKVVCFQGGVFLRALSSTEHLKQ